MEWLRTCHRSDLQDGEIALDWGANAAFVVRQAKSKMYGIRNCAIIIAATANFMVGNV